MIIKFTKSDFHKCFEFAVKYYLDETKPKANRTTGQYRGLGSIINDFFLGKLIEIGVKRAIEKYSGRIKCNLDFTMHESGDDHRTDPDIIAITERGAKRTPRLFIETKNVSESDRYVGLTQDQLNTILENETLQGDPGKLYIVYACIKSKDKIADVFGVYLKSMLKDKLLSSFSNINNIFLEIKSIVRGSELKKYGIKFNKGSLFYETDIVSDSMDEDKADKIRERYKGKVITNGKLPVIMMHDYPKPREFGSFYLQGKIRLFVKKNDKSRRVYADCLTKATIKNKVVGDYRLKKGRMYELCFSTIGRNPTLSRNNIWIANRNLSNIISAPIKARVKFIAKHI